VCVCGVYVWKGSLCGLTTVLVLLAGGAQRCQQRVDVGVPARKFCFEQLPLRPLEYSLRASPVVSPVRITRWSANCNRRHIRVLRCIGNILYNNDLLQFVHLGLQQSSANADDNPILDLIDWDIERAGYQSVWQSGVLGSKSGERKQADLLQRIAM
jgi:hypothetical protein